MSSTPSKLSPLFREWPLALVVVTLLVLILGKGFIAPLLASSVAAVLILLVICAVILAAAVATVRHADVLAHRLGEPFGTLLLTLAITGLEVAMVGFVMSTGDEKPTLARDTMFAVVMLVINGFMGLSLLLGGLRHNEQSYNLQSANAFLILIIPLTVLGLVLPNFTKSTPGPTLSTFQMVFLSVMSLAIYAIFMYVQNRRHKGFFVSPEEHASESAAQKHDHQHAVATGTERSTLFHSLMLGAYGLPLVMLAKQMSLPLESMVERLNAPIALSGFIMATLVLTPESIAAVKAARENRLQRSVNVLLGSVLASIGLTIPLVITISLVTGRGLTLGLEPAEMILLALTLFTATLTFALPRTNVLLGCVHLLLFGAYFMLMFD
jgi:Ca2+:H+ antiporter